MSCTTLPKAAKPVWAKQLTRLPCLVVYVKFQLSYYISWNKLGRFGSSVVISVFDKQRFIISSILTVLGMIGWLCLMRPLRSWCLIYAWFGPEAWLDANIVDNRRMMGSNIFARFWSRFHQLHYSKEGEDSCNAVDLTFAYHNLAK